MLQMADAVSFEIIFTSVLGLAKKYPWSNSSNNTLYLMEQLYTKEISPINSHFHLCLREMACYLIFWTRDGNMRKKTKQILVE